VELLAAGRASKVYALSDTRVLRRCEWNVEAEARLMRYLALHYYPVPEVYEVAGGDMVMERLEGPTLAASIATGQTAPGAAAAILDDLLDGLFNVPTPDWLPTEARGISFRVPSYSSVLHLDLHPENVILTPDGPYVIDWTNAAAGDHGVDCAVTWAIIAELDPAAFPFDLAPLLDVLGEDLPATALETALRFREADPNITAAEHARARAKAAAL
jgi:aminoglycoside phosphotransferase (APT) family kinase protein